MGKIVDLTGQRFGRLTVLERAGSTKYKKAIWHCKCDCGNEKFVIGSLLIRGESKSCGCLQKEKSAIIAKQTHTKHGQRNNMIYHIWRGIKIRCFNSNSPSYKDYGARGITMCDKWKNDFMAFYNWAISNGYKEEKSKSGRNKLTIDRIDNNGNYEPSNCRWATYIQQARNRTNNHLITYKGKTHCLIEWAEILNLPSSTLYNRICSGWDINRAFTTPHKKEQLKERRKPLIEFCEKFENSVDNIFGI